MARKLFWNQLPETPELLAPELHAYREATPPPTFQSSSSVENSPPKSIEALKKNQKKCSNILGITPKQQRNLDRVFEHNQIIQEHAAIVNDIITKMRAFEAPLKRPKTKGVVRKSETAILEHLLAVPGILSNHCAAGRTPFFVAFARGSIDAMMVLLNTGRADINASGWADPRLTTLRSASPSAMGTRRWSRPCYAMIKFTPTWKIGGSKPLCRWQQEGHISSSSMRYSWTGDCGRATSTLRLSSQKRTMLARTFRAISMSLALVM